MDALDKADETRFERHLTRCPACAQESISLREATILLGQAVAGEPPAELNRRTQAAVGRTRQRSPVAGRASQWLRARRAALFRLWPWGS